MKGTRSMNHPRIQRIVCISDTHDKHGEVIVPEGDLLIHSGDLTSRGYPQQVRAFMEWFGELPHPHKVVIAGNHDFMAESNPAGFQALIPEGVHYLNDSGLELDGIKIWGSPITPWFHDWAFNRHRGDNIAKHWAKIPPTTDILITHGPPFGILDKVYRGQRVGCEELIKRLEVVRPKLHVFGHIHEAYGQELQAGTLYVNASVLNLHYRHTQAPVVLDWPLGMQLG